MGSPTETSALSSGSSVKDGEAEEEDDGDEDNRAPRSPTACKCTPHVCPGYAHWPLPLMER